uniref:Leucine-rich repeat-containing N-terminal plant-type domain-containing protein n=1 Tax=Lactuca sativa TaxID=4236 RepID=A0A9R1UYN0_LACSA|nr:hypothetical protein LSAT_V11C700373080 [Lactuca sativa]
MIHNMFSQGMRSIKDLQSLGMFAWCWNLRFLSMAGVFSALPKWMEFDPIGIESFKFHSNASQGQNPNSPRLIVDIAHNSFNGTVPVDCFWKCDAMMTSTDGEASGKKHLSFTVLSLDPIYYQDTMTVTIKGLDEILDTIRRLNALYMFNVSHNDFTGLIPPSIGNLSQLESLDMSWNKLTRDIPSTLTNLPFLSSFNLSYNQLEGRIPTGSQFQTFQQWRTLLGARGGHGLPAFKTFIN